ncbi:MAG: 50S ribosomal protein L21 [Flavobacteriales bacterium Tduv]
MEIAGIQHKVTQGRFLYVPRLKQDEGAEILFDRVCLLYQEGIITVGAPLIEGATIQVKVLQHLQDDKIIVFKKKRRKRYKVKRGHRQQLTKIEVLALSGLGTKADQGQKFSSKGKDSEKKIVEK